MSLLSFENLFFTVGSGDNQKDIIQGVSHTIEGGQVVAILGPSGSGKTTLMNILSLRAGYGKAYGTIQLHGQAYNGDAFKKHAFYVQQYDKNWDHLTCSETMTYAAKMFGTDKEMVASEVKKLLGLMGLNNADNTRCKSLSGGQQRRLSLAIALLKNPSILFLDEITSGLDSVSSFKVCELLRKVANERNIAVICTIHQPSTKVFHEFDQVMILSMGRLAYAGRRDKAVDYFADLGYPIPSLVSESEHYLNTVDADFGNPEKVQDILNIWTQKSSLSPIDQVETSRADMILRTDPSTLYFRTLLSRQLLLTIRDPVLYLGRTVAFLIINSLFGFVYWNTRAMLQIQALNKLHLILWFLACPSLCGVVAVVFLNEEYKAVLVEVKNGMYNTHGYIMAKIAVTVPTMIIFGLAAIVIPMFLIGGFDLSYLLPAVGIWSLHIFVFESVAECLAIWLDSPILGMMGFLGFWALGFLCCGIYLPVRDMFWPIKIFYHISSFGYYARSTAHILLDDETFDSCDVATNVASAACTTSTAGSDVVFELQKIITVIADDNLLRDTFIIIGLAIFYKIIFIIGLVLKAKKFHAPEPNPEVPLAQREAYAVSIARYMKGEKRKNLTHENLQALFASIDKDNSGAIEEDEFYDFTEECEYCDIDRKECKVIFKAIDLNHNRSIDFLEFCMFFKSLPTAEQFEDNNNV